MRGMYVSGLEGRVNQKMTLSSDLSSPNFSMSASRSMSSHSAFCGEWMSTSGMRMGTRPLAMIRLAMSNCCAATALMPAAMGSFTRDRIFVPKMPTSTAFSKTWPKLGGSAMSLLPSFSLAKPHSIFRKGTTFFCFQRYSAQSIPSVLCTMVSWDKVTPITRTPLNFGCVMMRSRMACIAPSIACLSLSCTSTPYLSKALPICWLPLWSSAAKKPSVLATLVICTSLVGTATEA
mmetsp:Transcript_107799/g.230150  ORF Transcript_107799/g.230150 Transcript_107799/m.230150 type:complete len:234 (+) Transcript_107799:421-1122(+)